MDRAGTTAPASDRRRPGPEDLTRRKAHLPAPLRPWCTSCGIVPETASVCDAATPEPRGGRGTKSAGRSSQQVDSALPPALGFSADLRRWVVVPPARAVQG